MSATPSVVWRRSAGGGGIAHQIALARRESPHLGQRHVGLAKVLASEMPDTFHALRHGHITEWTATLLARETACLSLADRKFIDHRLCVDPEKAERMSAGELAGKARKLAGQLDPASVAARRSRAEADRHVSIRPAPDTMTWLTGHLPVKEGVAVYAALRAESERLVGIGDGRSRSQIMADTLVERVLGGFEAPFARTSTSEQHTPSTSGQDGTSPSPGLTVNVVIGVDSLLAETDDGAEIPGYGPIPAHAVRDWIREGLTDGAVVELRRLFADPDTGQLVRMESRARHFPRPLAELVELRDLRCRTPWCDAPVRHADHVVAKVDDGQTGAANGQGLCESCNYAKEAIGWEAHPRPGPSHEVETTTPTGHRHRSRAPSLLGGRSRGEQLLADLIWAA